MVVRSASVGTGYLVDSRPRSLKLVDIIRSNMNRKVLVFAMSLLVCGAYSTARAQDAAPSPDNSGINVRDRGDNAMTAGSQSNSKSDTELTANIRRAVVKDKSLSMTAHNVKIITVNGQVTLRGPVKTDQEKAAIASEAESIAGADKVDNQLQVVGQ
jgi:hyperosmotically inducible periplasmic protein